MLPFSDLSYIVVIVKRIQNALFVLLAMTELIVRVIVSSNKIRRVVRSNKHSWAVLQVLEFEQETDQKQPPEVFYKKMMFLKMSPISPISQWKETPVKVLFCGIGEIFKKLLLKNICERLLLTDISSMVYLLYTTKNIFSNICFHSVYAMHLLVL